MNTTRRDSVAPTIRTQVSLTEDQMRRLRAFEQRVTKADYGFP